MKNPATIGILRESTLHAELKNHCSRPGDRQEVVVDGYHIDIVRGEELIEIQTACFAALKPKLAALVPTHPVRLVYPISREKVVVRLDRRKRKELSRRRSPKAAGLDELFLELVSIPDYMAHANFSLEVLFVAIEEIRVEDGKGSWRRHGQSVLDRKLIAVLESRCFSTPEDFRALLPPDLETPFDSRALSAASGRPRWVAQKMLYCLRKMNAVKVVGRKATGLLYAA